MRAGRLTSDRARLRRRRKLRRVSKGRTDMKRRLLILALFLAVLPFAFGGSVVLKKAWVKQYKDRATIDAKFTVDHAHKKPNAAKNDGDMHVAGRAPTEVGLPMVAEV